MHEIIIKENDAGQRLDKFLSKNLRNMPSSLLYKSLRKKCVRLNGKHVRDGSVMLRENDVLRLYINDEFFVCPDPVHLSFDNASSELDVVFEDQNIIVMNKPKGLDCHGDDDCLVNRMKKYLYSNGSYDPKNEQSFVPALSNRLDRNTEGLVIGAKNAAALREMNERIRNHEVKKIYSCTAEGVFRQKSGTLRSWLLRRERNIEVFDEPVPGAKEAVTIYKVTGESNGCSELKIELVTGRTHQIRAQLAHLGHPLRGDVRYGGKNTGSYQELVCREIYFNFKKGGILDYLDGIIIRI